MFGPCRASRRGLAGRAVFLFVALSLVALVSSDADAEEGARVHRRAHSPPGLTTGPPP